MADREKVINGLEYCIRGIIGCQQECPYKLDDRCGKQLMTDALELLKEQEPQETRLVHHYSRPGVYADLWLHCEKCGGRSDNSHYYKPKYCPECGRKVKWDG